MSGVGGTELCESRPVEGGDAVSAAAVDDFRAKIPRDIADSYHVLAPHDACCAYFIKRKRRQCSRRRADGSKWCSLHEPSALEAERARCKHVKGGTGGVMVEGGAESCASGALKREGGREEGGKKTRLSGWRRRRRAAEAAGVASAGRVSSVATRMQNPFSSALDLRLLSLGGMPDWGAVFTDRSLPVLLDVGCARGMFVDAMSAAFPARNYIGVEIRAQLVDEALARTEARRSKGCNLMFVAANVLQEGIMADLLSSLAAAGLTVDWVTVQFPDPWLAPKHKKRRTVSAAMATACAEHLPPNGKVYLSSDVPAVLWDGAETLAAAGFRRHCRPAPLPPSDSVAESEGGGGSSGPLWSKSGVTVAPWTDEEGLLLASPVGGGRVFSERDVVCEDLWRKVYRVLLTKP